MDSNSNMGWTIVGYLPHPTQLNSKLGKPYFPKKQQTTTTIHNHKPQPQSTPKPYVTISASTQSNSTKFDMQPYFNQT